MLGGCCHRRPPIPPQLLIISLISLSARVLVLLPVTCPSIDPAVVFFVLSPARQHLAKASSHAFHLFSANPPVPINFFVFQAACLFSPSSCLLVPLSIISLSNGPCLLSLSLATNLALPSQFLSFQKSILLNDSLGVSATSRPPSSYLFPRQ